MIYLDYQATTPLAPEVRAAMLPWLDEKFGNPHSPHRPGREAAAAVAVAEGQVAQAIGGAGRVVFTSGATEAINWAIRGALELAPAERRGLVVLASEHAAVLDTAAEMAARGARLTVVPVGRDGLVDLDAATAAIGGDTALVAAMLVNNEIGVIQPIAALGQLARAAGALMLCDAVQGLGRVPIPTDACDMVAVSAHKIHAPKGIGALWLREDLSLPPMIFGGGQQDGLRSGTLSPMLCAGFGAAAALAAARMWPDAEHCARLAERLLGALGEGWIVNGNRAARWPGNLNLRKPGLDAARLISEVREVAFSAGSACASGSGRPSHVLRAIGLSDAEARGSIRLGFGRYTTEDEIDRAAALIRAAADRQQAWA